MLAWIRAEFHGQRAKLTIGAIAAPEREIGPETISLSAFDSSGTRLSLERGKEEVDGELALIYPE